MRRRIVMGALAAALGAAVLAGAACGGSSDSGDDPEATTEVEATVETDGTTTDELGGIVANSPASIVVSPQSGDGSQVTVDEVDLPAPGFVLVLDPTTEVIGELGQVIGVSELLPAGVSSDVAVALDPPLAATGTLFAEPHVDSNQNGVLDWDPVNGPVTDLATLPETGSTIKTFAEFEYTVE